MKKALVSFNEISYNGYRICEVVPAGHTFPVAEKMSWVDCAEDVVPDIYYYNPTNGQIEIITAVDEHGSKNKA
jgi:hypothetical protein